MTKTGIWLDRSAADIPNGRLQTSSADSLQSSVPGQLTSAVRRLLPVMPASQSSDFRQIAVIPSAIAVDSQCLVLGEKQTVGSRQAGATLRVRYH